MAKIKRKLTIIEEYYYTIVPEKQQFFKEVFKKINNCSDSTFSRRLMVGNSVFDLALFQYVFSEKIFVLPETKITELLKGLTVPKYSEENKNQLHLGL
jgi:hypothetical protein